MQNFARAAVYEAPNTLAIREFPLPAPSDDDLFIETELCGVDGSELHMFKGELEWFNKRVPVILGDEVVGRVSSMGRSAAVSRGLSLGDRVVVEARWSCHTCRNCTQGQYYLCLNNQTGLGYGTISTVEPPGLWGGYATHVYVPKQAIVYKVPESLSAKGALVAGSTLANGIRWTEMVGAKSGDVLAIIGPGPQGIACALAAFLRGARVAIVGLEKDRARLGIAEEYGAVPIETSASDTPQALCERVRAVVGDVDAVIEAAGTASAKALAHKLVRSTGTVAHVSIPNPGAQPIDWLELLMKEVTVINPVSHPHTVAAALALGEELLLKGIDVGELVSHVFPLDRAQDAIRAASYQGSEAPIKVALDPRL